MKKSPAIVSLAWAFLAAQGFQGPASAAGLEGLMKLFQPSDNSGVVVAIRSTQTAKIPEVVSYKSIGIANFSGSNGPQLAKSVESALAQATLGGKRALKLIPPEEIAALTGGRPLTNQMVAQIGTQTGADALIQGEVTGANVHTENFNTTEQECAQRKGTANNAQKIFGLDCAQWRSVNVSCTKKTAVFPVFIRVYDAHKGTIVHSTTVSGQATDQGCKGVGPKDDRTLSSEAANQVIREITAMLSPRDVTINVPLMSLDAEVKSPEGRQQFESALVFAKDQRVDRACELFRSAYDGEKQSVALTFNVGVCEEYAGNMWRAYEHYQIADKMLKSPNKAVGEALARTEQNDRNRQQAELTQTASGRQPVIGGAASAVVVQPATASAQGNTSTFPRQLSQDGVAAMKSEKRVALVIGNAKYRGAELRNPVNDAKDIAQALRGIGFEVIYVENGSREKMGLAVEDFAKLVNEQTTALFYYAGHGVQVKGENYLMPVDADIKSESETEYKAINVGLVLTQLGDRKARVGIVILDACRDNPFVRSFRSTRAQGLASIDAPQGTLIAYATGPGKTAIDGTGRNGLYTAELLKEMKQPNMPIEDVFKRVRVGVMKASNNEQVPWESSSLTGDFAFATR